MLRIEPIRVEEYSTFASLFPELETGDPIPIEEHFRRELLPDTTVARDASGAILGYAFCQTFADVCYVRHLVTTPAARRRGVGRALMHHAATRARDRGAERWQLNVKTTNAPALRLYASLGLSRAFETVVLRTRWSDAAAGTPRLDPALTIREPAVAEYDAVERSFGLPSGLLDKNRHKVLRGVFDARGGVHAFACFDPGFCGIFPLRTRSIAAADALLRELSPHAHPVEDPDRPWRRDGVQIVVEDAEETALALAARGAAEVFRIVQLRGPLPPA